MPEIVYVVNLTVRSNLLAYMRREFESPDKAESLYNALKDNPLTRVTLLKVSTSTERIVLRSSELERPNGQI